MTISYSQKSNVSACNASNEALELCSKNGLAPDPVLFSVFFTYLTQRESLLAASVNELMSRSSELSYYDLKSIYEQFFLKDAKQIERSALDEEIECNVVEIATLLGKNAENAKDFVGKLDNFGSALGEETEQSRLMLLVDELATDANTMKDYTLRAFKKLEQFETEIQTLRNKNRVLSEENSKDALTSLSNRGAFDDALKGAIKDMRKTNKGFCLVMTDLDRFKLVNDQFGHQVGDQVLKFFAKIMLANTKGADTVARYGGEEFAIILPDTDLLSAHNLMVKIKHELQQTRLIQKKSNSRIGEITASFGLTKSRPNDAPEDIIGRADDKLYEAKYLGRNRVVSEVSE
jgi:diguanylate cyclase